MMRRTQPNTAFQFDPRHPALDHVRRILTRGFDLSMPTAARIDERPPIRQRRARSGVCTFANGAGISLGMEDRRDQCLVSLS